MAIKAEPGPTGIATENCLNDGKSRESHLFDQRQNIKCDSLENSLTIDLIACGHKLIKTREPIPWSFVV